MSTTSSWVTMPMRRRSWSGNRGAARKPKSLAKVGIRGVRVETKVARPPSRAHGLASGVDLLRHRQDGCNGPAGHAILGPHSRNGLAGGCVSLEIARSQDQIGRASAANRAHAFHARSEAKATMASTTRNGTSNRNTVDRLGWEPGWSGTTPATDSKKAGCGPNRENSKAHSAATVNPRNCKLRATSPGRGREPTATSPSCWAGW